MKESIFRDETHPWIKLQKFKDLSAPQLLRMVQERSTKALQRPGPTPAWVFDLDSTLFCTGDRLRNIYAEFLREHPQAPLLWQQILPRLHAETQRYDLERTFVEILRQTHVARAEEEAKILWEAFRDFWRERFFLGRHMYFDRPYQGAAAYVHQVAQAGFEVLYLSGRDGPRAYSGTYQALLRSGFPWGSRTHLILKPHREMPDLEFKTRALETLKRRFRLEVLIDNEPENLLMFAETHSEADIVLFHSIMSPRLPLRSYPQALGGRPAWRLLDYLP